MDFPVEVQVIILLYLCPIRDVLWSEVYKEEGYKIREIEQGKARELHVMHPTPMSRRLDQTFRTTQDSTSKCAWALDGNSEQ